MTKNNKVYTLQESIFKVYQNNTLVFTCTTKLKAQELEEFAKTHTFLECADLARKSQIKAYGSPASSIKAAIRAFKSAKKPKKVKVAAPAQNAGLAQVALEAAMEGEN